MTHAAAIAKPPLIGITADRNGARHQLAHAYVEMVTRAGGVPLILPAHPPLLSAHAALCDGFVLTGGDDPRMECFGAATDPRATPVHAERQTYELALLDFLARQRPEAPVLAICLGMQFMGLHAGGTLAQHMPDVIATHAEHAGDAPHAILGEVGSGVVTSHHVQALTDAGTLRVVGRAPDGVIEAIADPARSFYLGVQWHPERTQGEALGFALFQRLIAACRRATAAS